jgi:hypothetical protein
MSFLSRIDRHQRLFSRMADTQGVDLGLEMQKGELSPEEYRGGVLACTGCSNPDGCETELNRGLDTVPDYCRNVSLIRRLTDFAD